MDQEIKDYINRFLDSIPFNKVLELSPKTISSDRVELNVPWRPQFVGNPSQRILHGGVISSVMDVTGGTVAVIGLFESMQGKSLEEKRQRIAKFGTIDLRVDYLRPGRGESFVCGASILRIGNKVAVTRMEYHNDSGDLLAVGTGTYMCG